MVSVLEAKALSFVEEEDGLPVEYIPLDSFSHLDQKDLAERTNGSWQESFERTYIYYPYDATGLVFDHAEGVKILQRDQTNTFGEHIDIETPISDAIVVFAIDGSVEITWNDTTALDFSAMIITPGENRKNVGFRKREAMPKFFPSSGSIYERTRDSAA